MEPIKKKPATKIGPVLSDNDVKDAKLLPALVSAAASSDKGLNLKPVAGGFQLEKENETGGKYRFCFARELQHHKVHTFSMLTRPVTDPVVLGRGHLGCFRIHWKGILLRRCF